MFNLRVTLQEHVPVVPVDRRPNAGRRALEWMNHPPTRTP